MKFEFNTEVDGAKEAAALATALTILHGSGIAYAIDKAAEGITDNIIGATSGETHLGARAVTELASDGYPAGRKSEHFMDDAAHIEVAPMSPPQPPSTLDTAGLPWDERIHASTKTTNKDGTWSRRRNTPDATFDTVMAALVAARDGATSEASAADAFGNPTPSEVPAPPVTAGSTETVSTTVDTSATSTTGQTATTAASLSSAPVSFPTLMVKITKAQTAGKIDKATVDGFLATFGLDKIAGLASAGADTIAAVNAMVDEHVGA